MTQDDGQQAELLHVESEQLTEERKIRAIKDWTRFWLVSRFVEIREIRSFKAWNTPNLLSDGLASYLDTITGKKNATNYDLNPLPEQLFDFFSSVSFLRRCDWEDVAANRESLGKCGWVSCPGKPGGVRSALRYRMEKFDAVIGVETLEQFCSTRCYECFRSISSLLTEEAVSEKALPPVLAVLYEQGLLNMPVPNGRSTFLNRLIDSDLSASDAPCCSFLAEIIAPNIVVAPQILSEMQNSVLQKSKLQKNLGLPIDAPIVERTIGCDKLVSSSFIPSVKESCRANSSSEILFKYPESSTDSVSTNDSRLLAKDNLSTRCSIGGPVEPPRRVTWKDEFIGGDLEDTNYADPKDVDGLSISFNNNGASPFVWDKIKNLDTLDCLSSYLGCELTDVN